MWQNTSLRAMRARQRVSCRLLLTSVGLTWVGGSCCIRLVNWGACFGAYAVEGRTSHVGEASLRSTSAPVRWLSRGGVAWIVGREATIMLWETCPANSTGVACAEA